MNHTTDTTTGTGSWRQHHDNLTPAQVRHLAALERIALAHLDSDGRDTAHQILDTLAAEAAWYAEHNPVPGIERATTATISTEGE